MNTIKMVASENLLQSVIISQNGDMVNGYRELIQNGIDAYDKGENLQLNFTIPDEYTLEYRDFGRTFGVTKEEVISNFFVFGNSGKSAEQLGKFGIGRGQIMAMIYDADTKELDGEHYIHSGNYIITDINIKELTAKVEEADSYLDGTFWKITSNKPIFKEDELITYISEKVVLDISIYVNGKKTNSRPSGVKYSTDKFDLFVTTGTSYGFSRLYERGIHVKQEQLINGVRTMLITKVPLELNFARNEVVKNKVYDEIMADAKKIAFKHFIDNIAYYDMTNASLCSGLMTLYMSDWETYSSLRKQPILKLANGSYIKPEKLEKDQEYFYADESSRISDAMVTRGFIVLPQYFYLASAYAEHFGLYQTEMAQSSFATKFENTSYKELPANSKEQALLNRLDAIADKVDQCRNLRMGIAPADVIAWTDGYKTIWFNRLHMEKVVKLPEHLAMMKLLPTLAHEYVHDSDNKITDNHDFSFYSDTVRMIDKMVDAYVNICLPTETANNANIF